jgi:hypothetical protein
LKEISFWIPVAYTIGQAREMDEETWTIETDRTDGTKRVISVEGVGKYSRCRYAWKPLLWPA